MRNALAGTPGVILTFEERDTALRRYAGGFGWDLTDLEENGMLAIISARIQPEAILAGTFDLRG